ncbi:hypothetical protein BDB01DRAFT_853773 [Pilobolus umbonatus]|nr:hypothetical protein BDB01DRAFT_853773 [Pilobolus umbonatus]
MKRTIESFVRRESYDLYKILHLALFIPDTWEDHYCDRVVEYLMNTRKNSEEDLLIIKQSHALIRRLQSPWYGYTFKNGEYYIVCHFRDYSKVTVYGYEMGPSIKGLKNIADYTLNKRIVEEDFLEEMLFHGHNEERLSYQFNVCEVMEHIYKENTHHSTMTLYDLIDSIDSKHRYDLLLEDKEQILKALCLDTIISGINTQISDYCRSITEDIIELSKSHYNIKVIIMRDEKFQYIEGVHEFLTQFPAEITASFHSFRQHRHRTFVNEAAQIVQDHLRIANYIPRIINKNDLKRISTECILHIDISWCRNSVSFTDLDKNNTHLEDIFSITKNRQYKVSHIVITGTLMESKNCPDTCGLATNKLKKNIEYQRKYHNDINVQRAEDTDILKEGMRSISKYPAGGLLEQIYGGPFLAKVNHEVHYNHGVPSKKGRYTSHLFIKEGTRITESMRINGILSPYYIVAGEIKQFGVHFIACGERETTSKAIKLQYRQSRPILSSGAQSVPRYA